MPWKVQPMSEIRFAFVHHILTGGLAVAEACRRPVGAQRKSRTGPLGATGG